MAKLTLTDIAAGYALIATINANNTLIETALENTLSRDGTTPNTMSAALDMNSNLINNLTDGVNAQDAVTLAQLTAVVATGTPSLGAIPGIDFTLVEKGDLMVFDGTNWVDLTAGTDGQALIANSAADSGLAWGSGGADLTADETITGNWTVDNATGFSIVNDAGDRDYAFNWNDDFTAQLLVSNAAGTAFHIRGVEQLHILTHNVSNNNQLIVYGGNSTVTSERIKLQHTGSGGSGQLIADSSHINIVPSSDGNGFVTVGSSAVHALYSGGPPDSDGALTMCSQTNLDNVEVGCQILEGANNAKCRMFLSDQNTTWGLQAAGDVTVPVFKMYFGATELVTAEVDYFRIDNGSELRIADAAESDWLAMSHDGTNIDFDFTNTEVLNINGRTKLQSFAVEQHTETSATNTLSIDMALGNAVDYTLTENLTAFTITNIPPSGTYGEIWLKIIQHASAAKTITWPAAFKFSGGTDHIMSTGLSAVDLIHMQTIDGGTTWYCSFHNDMS